MNLVGVWYYTAGNFTFICLENCGNGDGVIYAVLLVKMTLYTISVV